MTEIKILSEDTNYRQMSDGIEGDAFFINPIFKKTYKNYNFHVSHIIDPVEIETYYHATVDDDKLLKYENLDTLLEAIDWLEKTIDADIENLSLLKKFRN